VGEAARQDDGVEGAELLVTVPEQVGVGTEPSEGCHHVVLAVVPGNTTTPTRAAIRRAG